MLLITCPVCTVTADETAFACGGEAHGIRPQSHDPSYLSPEKLHGYLHLSASQRGWSREYWCCRGCLAWFAMLRHSETNEIAAAYRLDEPQPPVPGEAS
jgi:sarcosine oxidase subunit delta